jgi:hypothetical protein
MAREEGFFDDLARGLADGSITRGRALRLMGAALVGGALGSLGIGEAGADPPGCKRNGKHCMRDEQCCSGNCDPSGTCQEQTTTTSTSTSTSTSTTTPTTSTSTTPMCIPTGEGPCTADTQCCSRNCDPSGKCLALRGGSCTADIQCSGNADGVSFCQNGTCCSILTVPCNNDAECCGGRSCMDGVCGI